MNNEKSILDDTTDKTVKKIYHTPSIKLYGSINELVQANGSRGPDAGGTDDSNGS